MPSLFFPSLNSLRQVLASGLVPSALTRAPANAGFDPLGRLWLELPELPAREILAVLGRFGVQTLGGMSILSESVRCWAELLPLRQATNPSTGKVLFIGPDRQSARFAARFTKLSQQAIGISLSDEPIARMAWIVASQPPPRLVAEMAEFDSAFEAFAEQITDVWVRVGWEHQLPNQLVIPPQAKLILRPPRTVLAANGPLPTPENDDFQLPRPRKSAQSLDCPPINIPVSLSLAPNRNSAGKEALWVVEEAQVDDFWSICADLDERLVRRLIVANQDQGPKKRIVIRTMNERSLPAYLPFTAAYALDPRFPGLYVPSNRLLRPQVRFRELASVLGLSAEKLVWVDSSPEGGLIANSAALVEFRSLSEQLNYTVSKIVQLDVESRVDPFPFGRFVLRNDTLPLVELEEPIPIAEAEIEPEPSDTTPSEGGWLVRSIKKLMSRLNLDRESEEESQPIAEPARASSNEGDRRFEQTLASQEALRHGPNWAARRKELETALFLELPHMGAEGRAARLASLAIDYAKHGNPVDAAICWMNAAWEAPTPPLAWLKQWLAAECQAARLRESECVLERWLSERRPGIARVVAAYTAVAGYALPPSEFLTALPRILSFLDQHFNDLPVRAAWLARLAATRVCDGDALGLARWRDRVLVRLGDRGPGLDLDEPSFLRFQGSISSERFMAARKWLESIRKKMEKWIDQHGKPLGRTDSDRLLRWAGLIAEMEATKSCAVFMLSWGLGCVGERTQANNWAAQARKGLLSSSSGGDTAAYLVLSDLFLQRIKDAQEGRPPKAGLPAELQSRLESLPEMARYAVDRLREHSQILEPRDRVRAYRWRDFRDFLGPGLLGERLFLLAERTDLDQIAEEAEALLELCATSPSTDTVPRIIFTLLEIAPRLDRPVQLRILNLLPTAIDWMESWLTVGRWTVAERLERLNQYRTHIIRTGFATAASLEPALVSSTVTQLIRQLRSLGGPARESLLNVAAPMFQALRRLDQRSEAESLLQYLDTERDRGEGKGVNPLIRRLGLAAGWFTAGNEDTGYRILNEASEILWLKRDLHINDRTRLAIAYAETLAFAPSGIAHGRLEEIFERLGEIKSSSSTNNWYTLKPLQLIDVVIRSVVTDEFSLGPAVRSWLDDDEFLIRGRIHRDIAAVLRDQRIG